MATSYIKQRQQEHLQVNAQRGLCVHNNLVSMGNTSLDSTRQFPVQAAKLHDFLIGETAFFVPALIVSH